MIGPSQIPLPDNTQHSQETDIHPSGGIRTRNSSKQEAADPRIRPCGHWDRQLKEYSCINLLLLLLLLLRQQQTIKESNKQKQLTKEREKGHFEPLPY